MSINDESTPFSIYIDGTLTQDEVPSGEGMANFSALNKNLTLTIKSLSDEKATLDAGGKSRVINAKPASGGNLNLTLEKLVIKNGNAADTNNGGGIFVYGGTFTIEDCEITDNNAQKGGGLYVEQTTLLMKDTTISGSTATDEGGGMYVTNSNSIFTMAGGEISDNRAYSAGGGIYVKESKQATISGTTISVNTANVDGGGVFVSDSAMLTVNGTITGNTAQQGGGVYIRGGTLTMSDTATINGNKASGDGGGVYVASNASTFTMTGGTLSENEAGSSGGAVYVYDGKFIMDDGTISENTANVNGGGIYVTDGATVTMSGGTIGGNKASQDGGGVYITGNASTFTMNDGKIGDENIANIAQNGGGVYVKDNSTFTMTGGEINNNKAIVGDAQYPGQGAGVYVNSAKLEISGEAKISGNNAAVSGGGIYIYKGSADATLTMTGGEISENVAVEKGGGVYNQGGTLTMSDGTIVGTISYNEAKNGGGVYLEGGTFEMSGGEISDNKAIKSSNVATGIGAGVYVKSAKLEMSGTSKISGNQANGSGGGVFVSGSKDSTSEFTMNKGIIYNNKTSMSYGGGIYVGQNTEFTMNDGTISENSAPSGGGVYVSGLFTMNDGTIYKNNALSSNGGGVCIYGEFIMNKGTIVGNIAKSKGGGIYLTYDGVVSSAGGKFTMKGGTFSDNKTTDTNESKGAYIATTKSTFNMSGEARFDENDDVHFSDANKINIVGALSESKVATITPYDYAGDVDILSVNTGVTMDETLCNKLFSITPDNGTKWKISYDSSSRKGVLKKDDVSTKGGISVTLFGQGTYTFKVVAGSTEITEDSNLQSGTITLSEVKKDGTPLTANDGTFTIEIRDESGNPYPFPTASATGLPNTVTVPTVPVEQKAQVYVKVQLKDGSIIEKTIPVTIQP